MESIHKKHGSLHPPKPELALRVGFAGIRKHFQADLPGLRDNLEHVFKQIADDVRAFHREHRNLYDPHKQPRLILITSLAAGADQFAAKLALENGFELQVLLAYPREYYAKSSFPDVRDLDTFHRLIADEKTTSVLELDGLENETATYDAAGTVLVDYSDVLVAIWNGSDDGAPGGTANSVKKAIASEVPVVAFNSTAERPPDLYVGSKIQKAAELREILRALLSYGLNASSHPLESGDDSSIAAEQQKFLNSYYRETEKRVDWSFPYALLISIIRVRWSVQFRMSSYQQQAARNWGSVPNERWTDRARKYFQPIDKWADSLAIFYGCCMRGVVATSIVGGALILSIALGAHLFGYGNAHFLPYVELSPLLIVALISLARGCGVQRRWIEYRTLSELLRNYALSSVIGGLNLDRHRFLDERGIMRSWVIFYYRSVVRSFGLCNAVMDDSYLLDFRNLLVERVRGQVGYHRSLEERCSVLHHRIRKFGLAVFALTLAAPLLLLVAKLYRGTLYAKFEHMSSAPFIFAVISAAVAGFAAEENFARLAQVSSIIAQQLRELLVRVENSPLRSDQLRDLAGEAIGIAIQEHADWILLSSLRKIDP